MNQNPNHYKLAKEISKEFSNLPEVIAVALGGSSTGFTWDRGSDIDLYIFTNAEIPLDVRRAIAQHHNATRVDLDMRFWDPGDEWFDGQTGIEVDIMYWDPRWIEDQINLRLRRHQASLGYSTCAWHTIKHATVLNDQNGWLGELKEFCSQPYPDELRRAIIQLNYPVLRDVIPAYLHQIEKSVLRGDLVSINHRIAALLASYFDIIFALNRVTHPGEKRLIQLTPELCPRVPDGMKHQVEEVIQTAATPTPVLIDKINILIDGLDELLGSMGIPVDEGIWKDFSAC
jgi:hypothetical protein